MSSSYKVPASVFNFSDFSKRQLFYVDKTRLISDAINNTAKVLWYLYPRGFGKTINLNMLYNFFDVNHIFVVKSFYHIHNDQNVLRLRNQIPVVYLNFTDTESRSMTGFFHNFKKVVNRALNYFPFIFSNENDSFEERAFFQDIYDGYAPDDYYYVAIRKLIQKVSSYYKLKIILIIDGYDELFLSSMLHGYYRDFSYFFNTILNETIENNSDLYKVIFGGIFPFKTTFSLTPTFITNLNPFQEETPFQFSQVEAMQLIANVTTEDAKAHLANSLGFYALNRMTICPSLLIDSLQHREATIKVDYLLLMLCYLNDSKVDQTIEEIIDKKTINIGKNVHNIYLEDIDNNLKNNFLLALLNYGYLGISDRGENAQGIEVFIANEMSRVKLDAIWKKLKEQRNGI